jgi:hypothetical protein
MQPMHLQLTHFFNYYASLTILATILQLHLQLMTFSFYTLKIVFIHNYTHMYCYLQMEPKLVTPLTCQDST